MDVFNVGTELFAGWLLFLILPALVVTMYYFTVVRQPPKPFFASLILPRSVRAKLNALTSRCCELLSSLPVVGKYFMRGVKISKKDELEPLRNPEVGVSKVAPVPAVVIGHPLEVDEFGIDTASMHSVEEAPQAVYEIG